VVVAQAGERLEFLLEAEHRVLAVKVRPEHLEGDLAAEGPGLFGEIHEGRSALAENVEDSIGADERREGGYGLLRAGPAGGRVPIRHSNAGVRVVTP